MPSLLYRKNNIIFYVILCYENSLRQIIYVILVYDKFSVFKIHYDIVSSTAHSEGGMWAIATIQVFPCVLLLDMKNQSSSLYLINIFGGNYKKVTEHTGSKIFWLLILVHSRWKGAGYTGRWG